MTDTEFSRERITQLSQKQLMLLALELQDQLVSERDRAREPIAIVGLACRFPGGANTPEAFWSLMNEGRDAISEVPADRWNIDEFFDPDPEAPGKMSTRFGGFMDQIDSFDPDLFGISPREAESMDPQQRLLLEVSWEALERAGIAPDTLRGSRAGVFVGICNNDYGQLVLRRDRKAMDAYVASGSAFSVVAGRVAYTLGLEGATMVIDTACSSSLVAIHEACQYLRSNSVSLALAGGVNVICTPDTTIALSKSHMMAPDGRCKTFDDAANGFVRGEGCGVLVLKRLSDAQADGDCIHAVIRGSAVNQDGRSSGLTVPSGAAQARVIRDALAAARLEPGEISYIEAHGTGTSLGDPIEIRALGEVLCKSRPATTPLYVGSVKTNIGHLESAAGVAGMIKAVLAIQHERIPPHLHLKTPNHDVAWDELPIRIPTESSEWTGSRFAGVSSFGFSGTNAHVVLGAPPDSTVRTPAESLPCKLLPLSAKTSGALEKNVAAYADYFSATSGDITAACHTAAVGRAHLRERTAVVAADATSMAASLREGPRISARATAKRSAADVEPVFLFTGFGAQTPAMGRVLYASSAVFRRAMDDCSEILEPHWGQPLASVINCNESEADQLLNRTLYGQPALFAVEYALAALWRSWGIEPAAVAGHSLGEYVAACIAGVFSLEDALTLVAERARLIDALPQGGGMAAVFTDAEMVQAELTKRASGLDIAAINGTANVVVAGSSTEIEVLLADFGRRGIDSRRLVVSHAFHSSLMDPMLDELEACAARIRMRPPVIPLLSNLTARIIATDDVPDANYWRRHAREAVLFHAGARHLAEAGYRWFVEIGPHPTLLSMVHECINPDESLLVPSLRRGTDDWKQMLEGLANLYVHGAQVDWKALYAPYASRRVQIPVYPFERHRFWIDSPVTEPGITTVSGRSIDKPLLNRRLDTPIPIFETVFDEQSPHFIFEHRLAGAPMVSAPVFSELAIEACAAVRGDRTHTELVDFSIAVPLRLRENAPNQLFTIVHQQQDGSLAVEVVADHSDASTERVWTVHARAVAPVLSQVPAGPRFDSDELEQAGYTEGDVPGFYATFADLGIMLGPTVAGIRRIWHGHGDVVARLELPNDIGDEPDRYGLHPALADAALQVIGAALVAETGTEAQPLMLAGIRSVTVNGQAGRSVWCRASLHDAGGSQSTERIGDVTVYDDSGQVLAAFAGISLRAATRADLRASHSEDWGYRVEWPIENPASADLNFGAATQLAPTSTVAAAADETLGLAETEFDLAVYDNALAALDRLACQYIVAAFEKLRITEMAEIRPGELADSHGIASRHNRLLQRLFEILEQGGVLTRDGDRYLWTSQPAGNGDEPATIKARYPLCTAEVTLLERCGTSLAGVLRGEVDPVSLLFAEGTGNSLRHLYRETPFAIAMNRTLVRALEHALEQVPSGRPVRILEVGAGTGGTTAAVLPSLAGRRVHYYFTDVSAAFLAAAADEFADCSFISYHEFDVEREPVGQGFEPNSFDIVIAANVVHATRDISQALQHIGTLLAPGGTVLMLEGMTREAWVDLTFGLTDGWWRFEDTALRSSYPLLDASRWRQVLQASGFQDTELVSAHERIGRGGSQALIVTRVSSDTEAQPEYEQRNWLTVGPETPIGSELLRILPNAAAVKSVDGMRLNDPADFALTNHRTEIVYCAPAGHGPAECARATLECLQTAVRNSDCRLWLVTEGAAATVDAEPDLQPAQATVWGLGRGYALEHPESWGGLIDLDPRGTALNGAWNVIEHICADDAEDQVAWRACDRRLARLVRSPLPLAEKQPLSAEGAYLITGGTGGLGLALARRLAERGARHFVLTSRTPLPPRGEDPRWAEIEAVEQTGATVDLFAADVADKAAMGRILDTLDERGTPVCGVLHAAAAMTSVSLSEMTPAQLRAMLSSKVEGTLVLHELTLERPLDMFVLFSSTTALLGVSGLAHYSAANQFMDVFAHYRRSIGLPALAVNWGTWDIMRAASEQDRETFIRGGLQPMAADAALEAMESLLASGAVQHAVADIEWQRLKSIYEAKRVRPLLDRVGDSSGGAESAGPDDRSGGSFQQRLATSSAEARKEALVEEIRRAVNTVLKLDAARPVNIQEGFFDLGMDSLMAVELKNQLEQAFEHPLPSTLTFNYPNIGAVADYIESELFSDIDGENEVVNTDADESGDSQTEDLSGFTESALEQRLAAKLRGLGFSGTDS